MTGLKVSTFRERFTTLFEESEKTIKELAKELHVSYQTISAWTLGTRSPKEPTIIAISDYFGVDVRWLMGFDVEKNVVRHTAPIVIPDSERFRKVVEGMTQEEYVTVMTIYERAYNRLKERGEIDW